VKPRDEASADALSVALFARDWYIGFVTAGFTNSQAMTLTTEVLRTSMLHNLSASAPKPEE
jgi:hypothetical protein